MCKYPKLAKRRKTRVKFHRRLPDQPKSTNSKTTNTDICTNRRILDSINRRRAGNMPMKAIQFAATAFIWIATAIPGNAADVSVLSVAAVREALEEIIPDFEKSSGHKVQITWTGSADIRKRIAAGEAHDLIVSGAQDIDDYIKQGKMAVGSRIDLVKVGVGVGVPLGHPKPDISTTDALKDALLQAKAIGYSTGASGVYIEAMFKRLGIADDLKTKLKQTASGVAVGSIIAAGDVDIGFQQISELIHYPRITYAGPLPPEVQNITIYSIGTHIGSKQTEVAKALANAVKSPTAAPVISKHGLEQAN